MTDWLDPLNRIAFQRAFKTREPQVQLRDGREFILSYIYQKNEHPKVLVTPKSGLVPMGTFNLNVVTDPLWLESETGYTG